MICRAKKFDAIRMDRGQSARGEENRGQTEIFATISPGKMAAMNRARFGHSALTWGPAVSLVLLGALWVARMVWVNAWAHMTPFVVMAAGAGIGLLTFLVPRLTSDNRSLDIMREASSSGSSG